MFSPKDTFALSYEGPGAEEAITVLPTGLILATCVVLGVIYLPRAESILSFLPVKVSFICVTGLTTGQGGGGGGEGLGLKQKNTWVSALPLNRNVTNYLR